MPKKIKKLPLSKLMIERKLADTTDIAKALIMAGKVIVNDQRAVKAGDLVSEDAKVRLKGSSEFVSRGGDKLKGALEDFSLKNFVSGKVALDVGASTGGFTDCLIQFGADKVYALDVGTNQLAWSLRTNSKVESIEKTDIRKISEVIDDKIEIVVADISFNSLSRLLDPILNAVPKKGVHFLLLIKPQFELSSNEVGDGGIVESGSLRDKAVKKVIAAMKERGFEDVKYKDCKLKGRYGNQEIFLYAIS